MQFKFHERETQIILHANKMTQNLSWIEYGAQMRLQAIAGQREWVRERDTASNVIGFVFVYFPIAPCIIIGCGHTESHTCSRRNNLSLSPSLSLSRSLSAALLQHLRFFFLFAFARFDSIEPGVNCCLNGCQHYCRRRCYCYCYYC